MSFSNKFLRLIFNFVANHIHLTKLFTMKGAPNYFLLSALFFTVFLLVQFTDIYGNSTWFKFFVILLSVTFLVSGIQQRKKSKSEEADQP